MVTDLRSGKYGIDLLAATAMITSIALGEYWTGIIIAIMLTGGEALEKYAEKRAKFELTALLKKRPTTAHLIKGKNVTDIEVSKVSVGDKINVLPGEVVPADGVLFEGNSSFDESSITGESLPVTKSIGDQIVSGSINVEGAITIKVIRSAKDSQYEQIIKLVKAASNSQAPFIRLADRYAIPFTLLAFFIAGSVWFVSGNAIRFLEVIVVATPCPLLLAAPIALISGMSRASKHGIIIKNGGSLERLAEVRTVAFDKTGTLTAGIPSVDQLEVYKPFSKTEVIKYAASLEQSSNHILAKAIINYANENNIKVQSAKQVSEKSGLGLSGRFQGKHILVGRWDLMNEHSVKTPLNFKANINKNTLTYIAINDELAGTFSFIDEVRPNSKKMINRLKELKIHNFLMVTGDHLEAAKTIASKLGINNVVASAMPSDKMHAIEGIVDKYRPVAFVGDGVNDAPVLTISDVGIALGARGSTAASEAADVVIMLDDINKVASSIDIAKRTFFIAKQSILIGIFLSIALMAVFATGKIKPIYGAILQEIVDVFVIFNALRAHGAWQKIRNSKKEASL
jgi:heavy metal translocating P-type ATPase